MQKHAGSLHREGVVVLLTATIDPRDIPRVERRDPLIRLQDYMGSLRLWLADPAVPALVFCENSNYNLEEIEILVQKNNTYCRQVELLSFYGNEYRKELGKGYGELGILSHACQNSRLIGPRTMMIKVTGRHYIRNIRTLAQGVQSMPGVDVFCDLRGNLSLADSRVFCMTVAFAEKFLLPMREIVNESKGITFEHSLARAVHQCMAQGGKWAMLPCAPDIRGISGTSGRPYPASILSLAKREIFRRIKKAVLERSF